MKRSENTKRIYLVSERTPEPLEMNGSNQCLIGGRYTISEPLSKSGSREYFKAIDIAADAANTAVTLYRIPLLGGDDGSNEDLLRITSVLSLNDAHTFSLDESDGVGSSVHYPPLINVKLDACPTEWKSSLMNAAGLKCDEVAELLDVRLTKSHLYFVYPAFHTSLKEAIAHRSGACTKDFSDAVMEFDASVWRMLLKAADYMHRHSMCHTNITLDNILLDENCDPKLAGLESCTSSANCLPTIVPCSCAPPETRVGIPYDGKKADVWNIGICVLQLYLNSIIDPTDADFADIYNGRYLIPKSVHPNVANHLYRMLSPDPCQRPSANELLQSLPWSDMATPPLLSDTHRRSDSMQMKVANFLRRISPGRKV